MNAVSCKIKKKRCSYSGAFNVTKYLKDKETARFEKAKQDAKISDLAGDYQAIEWGSQIRSYVFQPYTMVKDHRTSYETANVDGVMDGDLRSFVEAYLRQEYENKRLAAKQI